MKRIDRLLISSYIPPFIVTFAIAMFVLLMQILWVYMDDIAGKGLGFFLVMELLAYKCVGLVPMALPLAVLISSVMVMGSLAEHYELSSFKSAGVSLLRTMIPIIIFGFGATALSYYCSNHLIPIANLNFGSRMFDIQQKKATLNLEPGVFNDDFTNYAIRIGRKDTDGRTIHDVIIYDHNGTNSGELSEIIAESGEMFASPDGDFFIMNLHNGRQYMESRPNRTGGDKGNGFPFIRTNFQSWTKVFDLSEFKLAQTNKELFSQNKSMMTASQLALAADSIQQNILRRQVNMANHLANFLTIMPQDSTFFGEDFVAEKDEPEQIRRERDSVYLNINEDSLDAHLVSFDSSTQLAGFEIPKVQRADTVMTTPAKPLLATKPSTSQTKEYQRKQRERRAKILLEQSPTISEFMEVPERVDSFNAFIAAMPTNVRNRTYTKARSFVRSISSQAESAKRSLDRMFENRVKYIYEQHTKYSMAVVCIIFVFIGAPMGAIVRKGGFGYPILISIIFFMFFVVMTIFCRKIAETHALPAELAAWLPCLVLFPLGLLITRKAMNDSKLFSFDRISALFARIFPRKSKV